MSRKAQTIVLSILVVILVLVWAGNLGGPTGLTGGVAGPERLDRFIVPNPSLRLDLLAEISKLDYAGMQRNIFNATPLPKQVEPPPVPKPMDPGPQQPSQPPPDPGLIPPFKFYGYVVDARSGHRRGFFTNGDDIWVAAVGEPVQRRFKVVSLSNTRAEVEEVSTGKRATLQLDETAAPSGG